MQQIANGDTFAILSFQDRKSGSKSQLGVEPHSVKRVRDGEVFSIGDVITNGMSYKERQTQGTITGFTILEGEIFVDHTWSGVGFNLESLSKVIKLPSKYQIDDMVSYELGKGGIPGRVTAVHFFPNKVKYDMDLHIVDGDTTRVYNVDSIYVFDR